MSSEKHLYMREANLLFREEKYQEAAEKYELAGEVLGKHLVEVNLWLCKQRAANKKSSQGAHQSHLIYSEEALSNQKQLEQSQALVEKYYNQVQELRFKLMDLEKQ